MTDNLARQMHYLRGKQEMSETHVTLLRILLAKGNAHIAELLGLADSEVSRKISGETGFKLTQLAALFDEFGVKLASKDDVVISKSKYKSLVLLANEHLTETTETLEGADRRRMTLAVDNEK